jgi:intraflagellar transport protein 140
VEHKKFDKAASVLASARQFDRTVDVCEKHNVKITEEMAEKLTACAPSKEENAEERGRVLRRLAKLCKQQGQWTLATKKFTQAGSAADKEEAMECLIKSSDADKNQKIVFFASTLKMQSVFVMAANYLQVRACVIVCLSALACVCVLAFTCLCVCVVVSVHVYMCTCVHAYPLPTHAQTLDWHSDGEIMKHIVGFYTKAKAFDNLSLFYDACAQVEVDDYR